MGMSSAPMTSPELRAHGRGGTALALLYVFLWSSAFVPSRVVSRLGQPLWVLTLRFAIAAVLMALVVFALRRPWPRTPAAWAQIAGYGLLANATYLGCTYQALRHLSAGMGAIIASTNPLLLALVAPVLLDEPITWRRTPSSSEWRPWRSFPWRCWSREPRTSCPPPPSPSASPTWFW